MENSNKYWCSHPYITLHTEGEDTLIVGQRSNYKLGNHGNQTMMSLQDIQVDKETSKLFTPMAVDYFVFSRNALDWKHIPKLVIGEPRNFLFKVKIKI